MANTENEQHRTRLSRIAHRVMLERGLIPDFSSQALAQLDEITEPTMLADEAIRDLRNRIWCSIDNEDSRDLDQLTFAQALANGSSGLLIAIADVDAVVKKNTPLDEHARQNTVSVYTAGETFPMLPVKLSTDITSLNIDSDRLAIVIEIVLDADGAPQSSDIYQAMVHNHAKLDYNTVSNWLEGSGPMPQAIAAVNGLNENIRLQDKLAQKLKTLRHHQGALDLEIIQVHAVFGEDDLTGLESEHRNRAKDLIENFMIAANGVTARYLEAKHFPSFRRVVRSPKRWDRLVSLAQEHGSTLPSEPNAIALAQFLSTAKAADPSQFSVLSMSVVKLLGPGEYVVQFPGESSDGHFALAVREYSHSTAPNRRYPDLITQRLLKAAITGSLVPYENIELTKLAIHCTEAEDAAKKVERQITKSAAATLLESRIGEQFDAIVTGSSDKGTWVRLMQQPIEGKLEHGFEGMDVGHRLRVQLVHVDVERGYIDFEKVSD